MKTIIYVDGYNLYYGRLKKTPYKWLDIVFLFKHICHIQYPKSDIVGVKYFTAPVKAKFASNGDNAVMAQNTYIRALEHTHPDLLEIVNGYQITIKATPPIYQKPINKADRVEVWKLEEKQTDVNIALHMYRDAVKHRCVQQVLVSGDTDLEGALKFIKEDYPEIVRGLVLPNRTRPKLQNKSEKIRDSGYLVAHVDWVRTYILDDECASSQLPIKIPTRKKPILKPSYW